MKARLGAVCTRLRNLILLRLLLFFSCLGFLPENKERDLWRNCLYMQEKASLQCAKRFFSHLKGKKKTSSASFLVGTMQFFCSYRYNGLSRHCIKTYGREKSCYTISDKFMKCIICTVLRQSNPSRLYTSVFEVRSI